MGSPGFVWRIHQALEAKAKSYSNNADE